MELAWSFSSLHRLASACGMDLDWLHRSAVLAGMCKWVVGFARRWCESSFTCPRGRVVTGPCLCRARQKIFLESEPLDHRELLSGG